MPTPCRRSAWGLWMFTQRAWMCSRPAPTSGSWRASAWRRSSCDERCSIEFSLTAWGWRVERRLDDYRYEHYETAKKFEHSSLAFGSIYQLAAALAYLDRIGLDAIQVQSLKLVDRLRRGLVERGFRIFTPEGTRHRLSASISRKILTRCEGSSMARTSRSACRPVSEQTRTVGPGYPSTGFASRSRSSTTMPRSIAFWTYPSGSRSSISFPQLREE